MDARLTAAADLFPSVTVGADIGANHGLLACHLLRTGKAQRMWITDLSTDALAEARRNIQTDGLDTRAEFAVGDGFRALQEQVEAAAILGMGGATVAKILTNAPDALLPPTLVISSHTEQELAREGLYRRGYEITAEEVVLSGGRYYILHLASQTPGVCIPDPRILFLGPRLTEKSDPAYTAYLSRRLAAYRPNRSPEGIQRYAWLREEAARAAADSQSSL